MANDKLRFLILSSGVRQWQIASAMGISESKFCKMLRTDLSKEKQESIIEIINKLKG